MKYLLRFEKSGGNLSQSLRQNKMNPFISLSLTYVETGGSPGSADQPQRPVIWSEAH